MESTIFRKASFLVLFTSFFYGIRVLTLLSKNGTYSGNRLIYDLLYALIMASFVVFVLPKVNGFLNKKFSK